MRDNWNELTIGNEINFLGGFPFSSSKFNEEGVGVPLIRIRDLLKSSQVTYFSGSYSNSYLINEEDILIGMDGDFHIVKWKNSPSLLNQRILKVSSKKSSEIDIDFLFYYLKPFLLDVHNKTAATTVKHLSTFDVSRAVDLFPPLPQQKKIAKILSTVDTVIAQTETAIAKYQAIKQGLMHDLFTRGIDVNTGKLRPTAEEAPALYKESALGLIPRDWEVEELGSVTSLIKDGTHDTHKDVLNGFPLLSAKDIYANKIHLPKNSRLISKEDYLSIYKSYSLEINDILLTVVGTIGRSAVIENLVIKFALQRSVAIVRIQNNCAQYVKHFMDYDLFQKNLTKTINASAQGGIYLGELAKQLIALPLNDEEQKIIKVRLDSIDQKIQAEQQALAKYQQVKAGLLQDLLTGKVEVSVE